MIIAEYAIVARMPHDFFLIGFKMFNEQARRKHGARFYNQGMEQEIARQKIKSNKIGTIEFLGVNAECAHEYFIRNWKNAIEQQ